MALWQILLLLASGLIIVLGFSLSPLKMGKLGIYLLINTALGLALLSLLNIGLGQGQLLLPLNSFTLAVSAMLGLPGISALAVLAIV